MVPLRQVLINNRRERCKFPVSKAWFPYGCICRICRVCRTKKIHRTDRIHSISYKKLYLSFLLYWAFVREVSIKLYLSYEFFSYDRYNNMETRLKRNSCKPRTCICQIGTLLHCFLQNNDVKWPCPRIQTAVQHLLPVHASFLCSRTRNNIS